VAAAGKEHSPGKIDGASVSRCSRAIMTSVLDIRAKLDFFFRGQVRLFLFPLPVWRGSDLILWLDQLGDKETIAVACILRDIFFREHIISSGYHLRDLVAAARLLCVEGRSTCISARYS
jgi:hypothetical protein